MWRRLVFAAAALALLGGSVAVFEVWRFRSELNTAKTEIEHRSFDLARTRLESLAGSRWGLDGGEVDYWLGVCDWASGRQAAAVERFRRVPRWSEFFPKAEVFRGE